MYVTVNSFTISKNQPGDLCWLGLFITIIFVEYNVVLYVSCKFEIDYEYKTSLLLLLLPIWTVFHLLKVQKYLAFVCLFFNISCRHKSQTIKPIKYTCLLRFAFSWPDMQISSLCNTKTTLTILYNLHYKLHFYLFYGNKRGSTRAT